MLVFLKCTQGISYSSHKSVEFMPSCNTLYGLMVHCLKNSRCEIMINIMKPPPSLSSLLTSVPLSFPSSAAREKDVMRVYLPRTIHLMS